MMIPSLSQPSSINQDIENDITSKDGKNKCTNDSNNALALSQLNYNFKMSGEKGEDMSY